LRASYNPAVPAQKDIFYKFVSTTDPTQEFAVKFLDDIDLNNQLGSFFSFSFSSFYLLTGLKLRLDTSGYLLEEIFAEKSSIYVFTNNDKIFYVDGFNFSIASSLVGKYFDIEIVPYITATINDVN
jgi:hypothetical protein